MDIERDMQIDNEADCEPVKENQPSEEESKYDEGKMVLKQFDRLVRNQAEIYTMKRQEWQEQHDEVKVKAVRLLADL